MSPFVRKVLIGIYVYCKNSAFDDNCAWFLVYDFCYWLVGWFVPFSFDWLIYWFFVFVWLINCLFCSLVDWLILLGVFLLIGLIGASVLVAPVGWLIGSSVLADWLYFFCLVSW
jgi:hypothetical protein